MDHGLELIQSYPGNRWKFDFYNFIISWKYWKSGFSDSLVAWKYWKLDFSNFLVAWKYWRSGFSDCLVSWKYGRRAGGSRGCVVLPWIIFGTCFLEFPDILEMLDIGVFLFSHILEIRTAGGRPRGLVSGEAWIIFGSCSWKNEHGNLGINWFGPEINKAISSFGINFGFFCFSQ